MELRKPPIMRIFHLTVDQKDVVAFNQEGVNNMTTSIENEPGTLLMFDGHDDQSGTSNYVIECYQDAAHYEIHANSPQFNHYKQIAKNIITGTTVNNLNPQFLKVTSPAIKTMDHNHYYAHLLEINSQDIAEKLSDEFSINPDILITLMGEDSQQHFHILVVSKQELNFIKVNSYQENVIRNLKLTVNTLVDQGELSFQGVEND